MALGSEAHRGETYACRNLCGRPQNRGMGALDFPANLPSFPARSYAPAIDGRNGAATLLVFWFVDGGSNKLDLCTVGHLEKDIGRNSRLGEGTLFELMQTEND